MCECVTSRTYNSLNSRRFLPTYVYIPFIVFFVLTLMWKKRKEYRIQPKFENQFGNNFNNCMYNPAILTPLQYGMYFIVIGAAKLLPLTITDKRIEMYPERWSMYPWLITLRNAPNAIIIGIIVPIAFYIKNQSARTYIKREFWDWAPDCIQLYNPYQPKINIIMKNMINSTTFNVIGRPEDANDSFEEPNPDAIEMVDIEEVDHSVIPNNDFVSTCSDLNNEFLCLTKMIYWC